MYKVAIVGATGAVGRKMVDVLERSNFPVSSLSLFASARSEGKKINFKGNEIVVREFKAGIDDFDLMLFSAGSAISKEHAKTFSEKGVFVIDNSSAWRMDPDVPLVVPEINPDELKKEKKLIANPNCSTIQMAVALYPIHKVAKIKRIVVATYQSVSGAGGRAIQELADQTKAIVNEEDPPPPNKFPHPIAFNLFPHIGETCQNHYTEEEMKMVNETKKIFNCPDLRISATCTRVPVFQAHSEAIWFETERKITVEEVKEILYSSPGIKVVDDLSNSVYPTPKMAENQWLTYVGRIREDISCENGIVLWVVSDNLLKGAALNAVQIAETLLERGIL